MRPDTPGAGKEANDLGIDGMSSVPASSTLMLQLLCRAETEDRTVTVIERVWSLAWSSLDNQTEPPAAADALRDLAESGFIEFNMVGQRYDVSPATVTMVSAATPAETGIVIDGKLAEFWLGSLDDLDTSDRDAARNRIADAVLSAAPYLARAGNWDNLRYYLEFLLTVDRRPATREAVLKHQRILAEATGELADLAMLGINLADIRPGEAEVFLRTALDGYRDAGEFRAAFRIGLHLVDALVGCGRPRAAFGLHRQVAAIAAEASVGPWSMLASRVQELKLLRSLGRDSEALDLARELRGQMSGLTTEPAANEVAAPFEVRELLLGIGAEVANHLRRWGDALAFLDDLLASRQERGASAHSLADAQFSRYVPLKELGDFDAAETILLYCREVYADAGDRDGLARTTGALGRVAWARGNASEATRFQIATLQLAFAAPRPHTVATAHRHLAVYLPEHADDARLAHGLVAAIVHRFAGNEQEGNDTIAEIAARHHEPARLATVTPQWLAAVTGQIDGVDLAALERAIGLDPATLATFLDEILASLGEDQPDSAAWTDTLVGRWEPAVATLIASVNGDRTAAASLAEHLGIRELAPEWSRLVAAFRQIIDGQRDPAVLLTGLDVTDSAVVRRALDTLNGRTRLRARTEDLPAVNEDARRRHQQFLTMVVSAARGRARARDDLRNWIDALDGEPGIEELAAAVLAVTNGSREPNLNAAGLTPSQARLIRAMIEAIDGRQEEEEAEVPNQQYFDELHTALSDPIGPSNADMEVIVSNGRGVEDALTAVNEGLDRRLAAGQSNVPVRILEVMVATLLDRNEMRRALPLAERLAAILATNDPISAEPGPIIAILDAAVDMVARLMPDSLLEQVGPAVPRWTPAPLGILPEPSVFDEARRWLVVARSLLPRLTSSVLPRLTTSVHDALLTLAEAMYALAAGDVDQAIGRGRTALELLAALPGEGPQSWITEARLTLAAAYKERGDLSRALDMYDELIAGLPSDRSDELALYRASLLVSRAGVLGLLGRDSGALADALLAERLLTAGAETRSVLARGGLYVSLGHLHETLGDLPAAARAYGQSLRIARSTGHRTGEAAALFAIGTLFGKLATGSSRPFSSWELVDILRVLPDVDPALEQLALQDGNGARKFAVLILRRAAAIFREANNDAGWADAANALSNVLGDDLEAIGLLEEVLQVKQRTGNRPGQAVTLANIGNHRSNLGDYDAAEDAHQKSLEISRPAGYLESVALSAGSLGGIKRKQGDLAAAEAAYREAVLAVEAARPMRPLGDRSRISFTRNREGAYVGLTECLLARDANDAAFNVVQQAKSRALLELVATASLRPSRPPEGRFGGLLASEASQLTAIRSGYGHSEEAERSQQVLDAIYDEMLAYDPEYVSMRRGTPATAESMRRWLAEQGRPVLLAEYFFTATSLNIFLLRAEWDTVRVHTSNITLAELDRVYQDFRRQVVQYRNTAGEGWAALSRFITEPLVPYLKEGDLVLLVPHRTLHSLPIHALPTSGVPLAARHAVAYAPACGLLPLCQSPGKGTGQAASCAAFGITYEAEAEAVAALFGDRAFPADSLRADALSGRTENRDIVHLSCHAYFNDSDPLGSGLYLRTGDMPRYPDPADILSARQIMPLNLRNELVTISACDTGAHREFPGDELVGLARAFFHAGTPTVVASLWAVDADTTCDLMRCFYTHLRDEYARTGVIDKAGALQQAQLQLMNTKGTRASYYWAPFVLIGDWR